MGVSGKPAENCLLGPKGLWASEGDGNVELPEGTVEVRDRLFHRRQDLIAIRLPESLESIGVKAFEGCTGLRRICLPPAVKKISHTAFLGCSALEEIAVDSRNPFFQSRQGVLFSGDGKTLLLCPNGKRGSFAVPQGVERIGPSAFRGCTRLTEILLPGSLRKIGSRALEGCTGLEVLAVPQGVKKLPGQVLKNCTSLVSLFLPQSLEEIDFYEGALDSCLALQQITVAPGNPAFSTRDGVLFDGKGETICYYPRGKTGEYSIPEGVQGLSSWAGKNAFFGCTRLTGLTLPKTMVVLSPFFLPHCSSLGKIQVDPENPCYCSKDGVLLSKDGTQLIRGWDAFLIPEGVTKLGAYSFSGCAGLAEVSVPEGVTVVGIRAFDSCPNLTRVTLPGSLTRLAGSAFANCKKLRYVFFANGETEIDHTCFAHCPKSLVLCAAAGSRVEHQARQWGLGFEVVQESQF